MNPPLYDPQTASYVNTVLTLYLGLPETPLRASTQDRRLARQLHQRGVALCVVESAFLLASVRRLARGLRKIAPPNAIQFYGLHARISQEGGECSAVLSECSASLGIIEVERWPFSILEKHMGKSQPQPAVEPMD
jgi:hypothetical protein